MAKNHVQLEAPNSPLKKLVFRRQLFYAAERGSF
jgi:hypothetical protein